MQRIKGSPYKFLLRNSNVSLIAFSTSLLTAEFDISAYFEVFKCSGLNYQAQAIEDCQWKSRAGKCLQLTSPDSPAMLHLTERDDGQLVPQHLIQASIFRIWSRLRKCAIVQYKTAKYCALPVPPGPRGRCWRDPRLRAWTAGGRWPGPAATSPPPPPGRRWGSGWGAMRRRPWTEERTLLLHEDSGKSSFIFILTAESLFSK